MSIYFMSLFVIPRRVVARLEKIQRDFLWGGGALEQKPLGEMGYCLVGQTTRRLGYQIFNLPQ